MSQCQARAEFFSVSIVKSAIFRTLPLWFCKAEHHFRHLKQQSNLAQFKNVNEGNATVMPQKRGEGVNWMEKRRGRTTGRRHNLPVSVPLAGFRRSDGGGTCFLEVPLTFRG